MGNNRPLQPPNRGQLKNNSNYFDEEIQGNAHKNRSNTAFSGFSGDSLINLSEKVLSADTNPARIVSAKNHHRIHTSVNRIG